MRITAHLGVLDEVELIRPAIEHLYRIGVDHVIVFDMGSRDGTREVVERLAGPELDLVLLSNDTPWEELSRRTIESVRRVSADWALFLDADEFWLPASGTLRDCTALAANDVVTVDRYNVVVTVDGPALPLPPVPREYPSILLYSRPIGNFRQVLESRPETPWIRGVPMPKVIARVQVIDTVTMGAHDVTPAAGETARRTGASDLLIAHVPVSGGERFRRRMDNIAHFLRLNPEYLQGAQAWHWKRFHEIAARGEVDDEYRRQLVDRQHLESLAALGIVNTAAQLLNGQRQGGEW